MGRVKTCARTESPRAAAASAPPSSARHWSGAWSLCALGDVREHRELEIALAKIADHLEDARALASERIGDPEQLGAGGAEHGRGIPVGGAMQHGARGADADGAGSQRLASEVRHTSDVLRGRGLAADAAGAHRKDPERAVRHHRGDVYVVGARLDGVEELGKALPRPRQALRERRARDVLDAFHQPHEGPAVLGATRREADAAVAHDDRRRSVPRRGSKAAIPRCLPVVVRMDIDEAGRHEAPPRVDLLRAALGDPPHRPNHAALDGHVAVDWVAAGAVEDGAVANDQVVRCCHRSRRSKVSGRDSGSRGWERLYRNWGWVPPIVARRPRPASGARFPPSSAAAARLPGMGPRYRLWYGLVSTIRRRR